MKITITAISERQHARTKSKNNCETFLYAKSRTLFKKQDNLRYNFIYKKQDNLRYAIFYENFEVDIWIQKACHFALRDVSIYKKPDTSEKVRQFALLFLLDFLILFSLNF